MKATLCSAGMLRGTAIRGELDAGTLDLNFLPVSRDKPPLDRAVRHQVLPRMREL